MDFVISVLQNKHIRNKFSCGIKALDDYIKFQVSQDIKKNLTVCFVMADKSNKIIAFSTLSNFSLPGFEIPDKFKKRLPKSYKNIPVTLLGRLAVDQKYARTGKGEYMLMHALRESLNVSKKSLGSMAVIVDPIDNNAVLFYKKYGFILLPDSKKMFLPMKTIEKVF
ncbi:MAG: hypothetical protein A2W91_07420 [Bacteroidetes bacterium GWF2_38_335]|nr:MAG: hypothetical protein A2W91_07420 [Bacteroidetes bacterium GWF2_38_335]OFY78553.1 MAG: hypothetical protein A2281_17710 [Bacteroidetes bacterium RIFOXYA12_FULL_38_20]HBS85049.1 GNAT family N-acetyltransferase [Bacteroidales bacterium]